MKTQLTILLTVAFTVTVLANGVAKADPFHNPLELSHPDWVAPFPYQRNIMVDFGTDPHFWPDHINSPVPDARKALTPLVVHHEGTDDAQLYPSDWLAGDVNPPLDGFTDWLDVDTVTGSNRQGLLKLEATQASVQQPTVFTLVWHIDNWDRPWEEKHFFAEAEFWSNVAGAQNTDEIVSMDDSYLLNDNAVYEQLEFQGGYNWNRWHSWGTLIPNPLYEEMINTIVFMEPGIMLIDYMHIGTECVPEPVTLGLLALDGVALLRRKH